MPTGEDNIALSCTRCRFYIGANDGSCLINCAGGLYKYTDTVYENCKMRPDFKYGDYWTDFEKIAIEEKIAAADNINKEGEE